MYRSGGYDHLTMRLEVGGLRNTFAVDERHSFAYEEQYLPTYKRCWEFAGCWDDSGRSRSRSKMHNACAQNAWDWNCMQEAIALTRVQEMCVRTPNTYAYSQEGVWPASLTQGGRTKEQGRNELELHFPDHFLFLSLGYLLPPEGRKGFKLCKHGQYMHSRIS